MKAAFLSLGCKVNSYETDALEKQFEERGYEIVPFEEKADVYIINTCSVTNMADRKSRQMIHRARKLAPDAVIAATGCYVQAGGEQGDDRVADIVVGNNLKTELVDLVETYLKKNNPDSADRYEKRTEDIATHQEITRVEDISRPCPYEETPISKTAGKTRAYMKIQDGCSQFCSYCIIPYTRGRIRSREHEDIIMEALRLAKAGYKEVVVTGIHLSSYGLDLEDKSFNMKDYSPQFHNRLIAVLKAINDIEGIERIRLGSLEPRIITEHFLKELSGIQKICPHFHLSLQSGCEKTLRNMNRKYSADEYLESLKLLRSFYPLAAVTTDVIVGFPMEDDKDFEESLDFVAECRFSMVHVFKYSRRKGTVADRMKGQVKEELKSDRSKKMIELASKLNRGYCESFTGNITGVLFEEEVIYDGERYYAGHTDNYIKVLVSCQEYDNILNTIEKVRLMRYIGDNTMFGRLEIE